MISELQSFCFLLGLGYRNAQKISSDIDSLPSQTKLLRCTKTSFPENQVWREYFHKAFSSVEIWRHYKCWKLSLGSSCSMKLALLLVGGTTMLFIGIWLSKQHDMHKRTNKKLPTFKWNFISTTLLCCRWPLSRTDVHDTSGSEVPRHLFLPDITHPQVIFIYFWALNTTLCVPVKLELNYARSLDTTALW